jgi:hypothetical protein
VHDSGPGRLDSWQEIKGNDAAPRLVVERDVGLLGKRRPDRVAL